MKDFSRFWKKCLVLSTQQCKRLVVYGSESRSQSQEWISWQILELSFIVIAFAIIIITITSVIIIIINVFNKGNTSEKFQLYY